MSLLHPVRLAEFSVNFFYSVQYSGRGRGRGRPANHPDPLNTSSQDTQHSCKETSPPLLHTTTHNNTQQQFTTALGYIKLPMYLLFLWLLYLMVLRFATSLLGASEGVGSENLDFFGPKWHSICSCHFRAQKSLDFQGPPHPMPLVMMLHASKPLHTAP